jgi:hypothetical protein
MGSTIEDLGRGLAAGCYRRPGQACSQVSQAWLWSESVLMDRRTDKVSVLNRSCRVLAGAHIARVLGALAPVHWIGRVRAIADTPFPNSSDKGLLTQ